MEVFSFSCKAFTAAVSFAAIVLSDERETFGLNLGFNILGV